MKRFCLSLIVIISVFSAKSQDYDFSITESDVKLGGVFHNTLSINIYETDKKSIVQEWKSELKKTDAKVSSKDEINALSAYMKDIGNLPFNLYSKVEEKGDKLFALYVAVDLGGTYLSSSIHPDKYKIFSDMIYEFATKMTNEGIHKQIKDAEKVLDQSNNDLDKLVKDNKKLNDNIEGWQDDIKKAENELVKNEEDQKFKQEEINQRKEIVNEVKAKLKKVK